MSRPRRCRRIGFMPGIDFFRPVGVKNPSEEILTIDEFESVRLKDLEGMDQEKSAKKMNISQPTFHRLVVSARKKIADAIVNGKTIRIQGGNYKMVKPRGMGMGRGFGRRGNPPTECVCPRCHTKSPKTRGIPCIETKCPKCGSNMVGN